MAEQKNVYRAKVEFEVFFADNENDPESFIADPLCFAAASVHSRKILELESVPPEKIILEEGDDWSILIDEDY